MSMQMAEHDEAETPPNLIACRVWPEPLPMPKAGCERMRCCLCRLPILASSSTVETLKADPTFGVGCMECLYDQDPNHIVRLTDRAREEVRSLVSPREAEELLSYEGMPISEIDVQDPYRWRPPRWRR